MDSSATTGLEFDSASCTSGRIWIGSLEEKEEVQVDVKCRAILRVSIVAVVVAVDVFFVVIIFV